MRMQVALCCLAFVCKGSAFAESDRGSFVGWVRGDGSLDDPSKNTKRISLSSADSLYFEHAAEGTKGIPSRVDVPDGFRLATFELVNPFSDKWTGMPRQDDSCAVTFAGPAKLWLQDWTYQSIAVGRTLTLESVRVESTNMAELVQSTGGFRADGRLLLREGSGWSAMAPGSFASVASSGELTIRDSEVDLFSLDLASEGSLRLLSGRLSAANWPSGCSQTNAQVRNARLQVARDVTSPSFFPSGADGVVDVLHVSDTTFSPTLAGGERIALRGRAQATNNTDAIVSKCVLTNDVAFYGRGTLNVGFLRVMNGCSADFDLENMELGYRIDAVGNPNGSTEAPVIAFRNGVNLKLYDNRDGNSTHTSEIGSRVTFFGNVVIDATDIYSGRVGSVTYGHVLRLMERAGFEYRGGPNSSVGFCRVPVRFARYALSDGTSLTEGDYNSNVPTWRRTHAYALGKNADHATSHQTVVEVASADVTVDPSARLAVTLPGSVGDEVYPVFCSLADGPLPCAVAASAEASGVSLKWVGGSAYCSTGLKDYGGAATAGWWLGAADGYWSTSSNWGAGQGPSDGIDVTFVGETRTVVTNDLGDVSVQRLAYGGGAPFILRGNRVRIVCTGLGADVPVAVQSMGCLPFVVECPLKSSGDFGCRTKFAEGKGLVALMGPVDATGGTFGPGGNIVVGGTVTCRELVLQRAEEGLSIAYADPDWVHVKTNFTELTVLKGGVLDVFDQKTANAVAGSLWIDKGGTVRVVGTWDWNEVENEHQVNGLLDLAQATVGGTAAQGYFGAGVVRIGSTVGSARVRLGEGLTLEATAADWGTMPIEATGDLSIRIKKDWTYAVAGGIRVADPGHALSVDVSADATATLATGVDAFDVDLVKTGMGCLALHGAVDGLARGTLDIRAGTVVLNEAVAVRTFKAAPGSMLAFGTKDGACASLSVDDDIDLSGLILRLAGDGTDPPCVIERFTPVLTVPWDCQMTGTPTPVGLRLRTVVNSDGSKSLKVKSVCGLLMMVR